MELNLEDLKKRLNHGEITVAYKIIQQCNDLSSINSISSVVISFFNQIINKAEVDLPKVMAFAAVCIAKNIDLINPLGKMNPYEISFNKEIFQMILVMQLMWTRSSINLHDVRSNVNAAFYKPIEKLSEGKILQFIFHNDLANISKFKGIGIFKKRSDNVRWKNMFSRGKEDHYKILENYCEEILELRQKSYDECRESVDKAIHKIDMLVSQEKELISKYEQHYNTFLIKNLIFDKINSILGIKDKIEQLTSDETSSEKEIIDKIFETLFTNDNNMITILILFELASIYHNDTISGQNGLLHQNIEKFRILYSNANSIKHVIAKNSEININEIFLCITKREEWFKSEYSFMAKANALLSNTVSSFNLNFFANIMNIINDDSDDECDYSSDEEEETVDVNEICDWIGRFNSRIDQLKRKYLFSRIAHVNKEYRVNESLTLNVKELRNVVVNKLDEDDCCCICNGLGKYVCPKCKNVFYCKDHKNLDCVWCDSELVKITKSKK